MPERLSSHTCAHTYGYTHGCILTYASEKTRLAVADVFPFGRVNASAGWWKRLSTLATVYTDSMYTTCARVCRRKKAAVAARQPHFLLPLSLQTYTAVRARGNSALKRQRSYIYILPGHARCCRKDSVCMSTWIWVIDWETLFDVWYYKFFSEKFQTIVHCTRTLRLCGNFRVTCFAFFMNHFKVTMGLLLKINRIVH